MCGSMYVSLWKLPCQERPLVSQNIVCVYDDYACYSMRMSECVCVGAHVCVGGCVSTNVLDLKREVPETSKGPSFVSPTPLYGRLAKRTTPGSLMRISISLFHGICLHSS